MVCFSWESIVVEEVRILFEMEDIMNHIYNIRGTFSRLRTIVVALCAGITIFGYNIVHAFGPLVGMGVSLTALGSMGIKGDSANELLHQAQEVIVLLKLFLIFATFLLAVGLFVWFVRLYKNAKKKGELEQVVALLASLQSDLLVLQGNPAHNELEAKKQSRHKIVEKLLTLLQRNFFTKEFNSHLLARILDLLHRIKNDKRSFEKQLAAVDSLLYSGAFFGNK